MNMADHISVQAMHRATAGARQGELHSYGTWRTEPEFVIWDRIGFGPVRVAATSTEILEAIEGIGPAPLNGVFNTPERFRIEFGRLSMVDQWRFPRDVLAQAQHMALIVGMK
jgi:hypothetical protein